MHRRRAPTKPRLTMTNNALQARPAPGKPAPGAEPVVAYLGPEGTYTHTAAQQWFPAGARFVPALDIHEIFSAVETGQASHGVVPVENSIEGSVTATLDRFAGSDLKITAELLLPIRHCLMAGAGQALTDIRKVVSHQQSLGQCRHWLQTTLPGIEQLSVSSNAEAARLAAEQPGVAAIAGATAARLYGLQVLAEGIADATDNTTRFLLLERENHAAPSGKDKTSLFILTANEPGSLFRALEPFHRHGVNLNKLESRPSRKAAWSYSFYLDIEGHREDAGIRAALQELAALSIEVKLLGSYPAAGAL
jgi:chorismate mutase/prephenate dehydratase